MKLSYLLIAILFTSCYSPRDSNGQYWKAKQVWKRIMSKKEHNTPYDCPTVKVK